MDVDESGTKAGVQCRRMNVFCFFVAIGCHVKRRDEVDGGIYYDTDVDGGVTMTCGEILVPV